MMGVVKLPPTPSSKAGQAKLRSDQILREFGIDVVEEIGLQVFIVFIEKVG